MVRVAHSQPVSTALEWAIFCRADLCYTEVVDVEERNCLRAEAHLPLLDVAAEITRLERIQAKAEFEREWDRRKPEFQYWIQAGERWFGKMGRWSNARRQVRE